MKKLDFKDGERRFIIWTGKKGAEVIRKAFDEYYKEYIKYNTYKKKQ